MNILTNSDYVISVKYSESLTPFTNKNAIVRLSIDYRSGTYSITPENCRKSFEFKGRNIELQKAVAAGIIEAIELAEKEINKQNR